MLPIASTANQILPTRHYRLQMNAATPVKEYASPWLAFGLVGCCKAVFMGAPSTTLLTELGEASFSGRSIPWINFCWYA